MEILDKKGKEPIGYLCRKLIREERKIKQLKRLGEASKDIKNFKRKRNKLRQRLLLRLQEWKEDPNSPWFDFEDLFEKEEWE